MRHRQPVHGRRRAGFPDEQRARHGRTGGGGDGGASCGTGWLLGCF